MSSVGSKNVREISDLQFKDGSHYAGQALEGYTGTLPYGYGEMTTKEGFRVRGLFKDGKSQGEGIFVAPNGDTFWGQWNKNHKRHGKGVSVRASDGTICVEEYDDGKLLKKVKRRPPSLATHHWLPPLGLPGTESRHTFTGDVPKAGHTGHSTTVTKDGGLIVLFGGEHANSSSGGGSSLTNDLYMLDVASGVWVKPRTSGTPPPPMQGHTATLVGRQLVIIGGQLGGIEASSSIYVLDIESGSWSCPIAKGLSFMNHTATLIGKEIWVIVQSSVFVLSLANWEWREVETDNRSLPRQIPRSFINHTAVAVGTMIYVHGGKWLGIHHGEGKKYERLSSDVRILHTSSLSWESPSCTPPIVPESDSSSVIQDYSGFVRGSWDVPRCEHTATLVGNKMYIFGGWTTANPTMNVVDTSYLNDLQILDVETMAWQYVAPFPLFIPPRSLHTTTQVGHELWVYGGRNSSAFALGDWNILNLPQGGASNLKKAVKPAAPNSEATTLALTSSTAPPISASSSSSSSSKSSSSFVSQSSTPLPPMPIESTEDELIDEGSAGSGSIMDAFLKG